MLRTWERQLQSVCNTASRLGGLLITATCCVGQRLLSRVLLATQFATSLGATRSMFAQLSYL